MSECLIRLQAFLQAHPLKHYYNWGNVSTDLVRGKPIITVVTNELHRTGVLMSNESMKRVLDNTKPDEPVFVLCGRDQLAPGVIREWASQARARGTAPMKVAGALIIAESMERWQEEHPDLVKVPD
jgi:hypothetical protein